MDLNINIAIHQPTLKPEGSDRNITYSDSRNLPLPNNTKHSEYIVKEGETITKIAEMWGVTPVQMSEWLRDQYGSDMLYPGQKIKVPTKIEEV